MTQPQEVLRRLVDDELAANPLLASNLGVTAHDHLLPDLSAEAFVRTAAREEAVLAELTAAETPAGAEDRADLELAVCVLRGRSVLRDWQDWRRNPDHYNGPGLSGVHSLFLHRLRPEPELVAAAAARLRAVPELLAQGRENLDPELASPLLVRRALAQARSGVAYTRDHVAAHAGDDTGRRTLAEAGAVASAAYLEFADFLADLADRATGTWAIGEARYDALLVQREGLSYGTRTLAERGSQALNSLTAELRGLCSRLRGDEDWRALLDELNDDAPSTPEQMLEEYASWTATARDFLVDRDLVTLPPGERCAVEPAPGFARATIPVAYYMAPPVLGDGPPVGTFFVPYPPEGADADAVRDRLRSNARFTLPTTAVHEAYPGHHWQFAHLAATQPRLVRSVFRTPYFTEGWALYAEQMMADQGFFTEPRHLAGQVEARLFRAARMVVDTALHTGGMTTEQATSFMTEHTALGPGTAAAEVTRYCAWPTQAPSYLTGALEIGRMAAAWAGSLRDFHDRLAGAGGLPIAVAERLLHAQPT